MKERSIRFSGPEVRATLEGRKTQTRLIVHPKRIPLVEEVLRVNGKWVFDTLDYELTTPFGRPGDRLWVREAWATDESDLKQARAQHEDFMSESPIYYRADGHENTGLKWRPSIHMPRWASRITLETTNVRVERLQGISHEDALAEGSFLKRCPCPEMQKPAKTPIDALFQQTGCYIHGNEFKLLWDSLNGPGSWDSNPWVWVVEFKRV